MAQLKRFIGFYEVTVDNKGRVHLPSKIRATLEDVYNQPLIVTIAASRGLTCYPQDEWVSKYDKLEEAANNLSDDSLEQKLRLVSGYANEVSVKNGRILIPMRLREYAKLGSNAIIIGRSKKIEIWAADRLEELVGGFDDDRIAKELRGVGF
ncbi:MAG: division/cell wall cluster transcriptional repressor MraZ [Nitrospinota bacterium]